MARTLAVVERIAVGRNLMPPLLSVIIPIYNRGAKVRAAWKVYQAAREYSHMAAIEITAVGRKRRLSDCADTKCIFGVRAGGRPAEGSTAEISIADFREYSRAFT